MLVYDKYLYPDIPQTNDDIIIYHCGFCSTASNYSYGLDTRNYFLLHYVTKGKGIYSAGKRMVYHLSKGDGFLIYPGQTIVHTADKDSPWDLIWVAFLGKEIPSLLSEAGLDKDHLIFHYDDDDYLETCIKNMYSEIRSSKNIAVIKGYFYLFIGKLINSYKKNLLSQSKQEFSHFDDAIIYINRNIRECISINNLANYLRMDPSEVYRIFIKNTGLSPLKYITNVRMKKACELLSQTDLSIREVSEWLGFEYQSHFTKQFTNTMKMSPTQYKISKEDSKSSV
jgi:AraC-like DNA-binding protein